MAILRLLNECVVGTGIFALEPARQCTAHCTYCFAALNSKSQWGKNREKNYDDPSTFESICTRAESPSYDPTNFMQWGVRNRLLTYYANTVEPFQDAPQALGLLRTLDKFGIPLLVQTKGVNFDAVFDIYKRFHDNGALFLSFPSDDDRIIKRFEPGTPFSAARYAVLERAANAGFKVILALSPYHEDWCDDPAALIRRCRDLGAYSVFVDRLHLNKRQRESLTDKALLPLADAGPYRTWTPKYLDHYQSMYDTCMELDMPIFNSDLLAGVYGLPNTAVHIMPRDSVSRGREWQYNDGEIFYYLTDAFFGDEDYDPSARDFDDSFLFRWRDAVRLMEMDGAVEQPFTFNSLRDLIAVKNIAGSWTRILEKAPARITEYYHAMWCDPQDGRGFFWRHPWVKIAYRPDGTPWTDDAGDPVALFDPDYRSKNKRRVEESLDAFRRFP